MTARSKHPHKGKPYRVEASPGMGTASLVEDGGDHPGEVAKAHLVTPSDPDLGGRLPWPHSPYPDEEASGVQLRRSLGFRSISGKY